MADAFDELDFEYVTGVAEKAMLAVTRQRVPPTPLLARRRRSCRADRPGRAQNATLPRPRARSRASHPHRRFAPSGAEVVAAGAAPDSG